MLNKQGVVSYAVAEQDVEVNAFGLQHRCLANGVARGLKNRVTDL